MSKLIALTLIAVSIFSIIMQIRAECVCGEYIGVHCGTRVGKPDENGETLLSGDCNPNIIYQCAAANIPAQDKGYCAFCAESKYPGADYCAIGRDGDKKAKAEDKVCTCSVVLGVLCGERYNDGLINGDCDFKKLYYCSAAYMPAQDKGKCSFCAKGTNPGTDYCAIGKNGTISKTFS